jgi:hypothetical protein
LGGNIKEEKMKTTTLRLRDGRVIRIEACLYLRDGKTYVRPLLNGDETTGLVLIEVDPETFRA